jgi:hypothetical protein
MKTFEQMSNAIVRRTTDEKREAMGFALFPVKWERVTELTTGDGRRDPPESGTLDVVTIPAKWHPKWHHAPPLGVKRGARPRTPRALQEVDECAEGWRRVAPLRVVEIEARELVGQLLLDQVHRLVDLVP